MGVSQTFPWRYLRSLAGFFLLCFTVAFLVMAKREFDEVTVNQILFHMQLMRDNIVTMPGDFIHVFFWHVKNAAVFACALAFLRERPLPAAGRDRASAALCACFAVLAFLVPGSFIDPVFVWVRAALVFALALAALAFLGVWKGVWCFLQNLLRRVTSGICLALIWLGILIYGFYYINFLTFFQEQAVFGDFYTEGDYVDPKSVTVTGSGDKNLIIVYCESIEETFGREEVMGEDLLAPLRSSIENPDLSIDQMPGADFTIGGIVASQCGIPLKSISILSGNLTGWALERFMPGAVCLGDYLHDADYHNVYYNGSSGVFSGLDKFFRSHGYQEFMGKEDWLENRHADPASLNIWALYDSEIIDFSIERIDELMAEGKKFSFALSTMDTHEPGFLSPPCVESGFSNDWPGYVKCSMSQVERLLRHIHDKGWDDRFVILVMGDHLSRMPRLGDLELKSVEGRYVLCSLHRDGSLRPMRSIITHFDLFPSLLAAMGFKIEGDRLGFGYNVFSKEIAPDADSRSRLKKRVLSHSKTYERLWLPEYFGKE